MNHPRRLVSLAATLGVAGGVAAAVLISPAESTPTERPFAAPSAPLTTGPALKTGKDEYGSEAIYLRPHRGETRIEVRQPDPAGGPEWAIRVMEIDRMAPVDQRRPHTDGKIGTGVCAQLGRIVGGRFGWIDGDNVFRPVARRTQVDIPTRCAPLSLVRRKEPALQATVLVDRPTAREPTVRGTAVWGMTGARVPEATLSVAGRTVTPQRSKEHGTFLHFVGPTSAPLAERLLVRYADGARVDTSRPAADPTAPGLTPRGGNVIDPGRTEVIARAPDPAGGPSWALVGLHTRSGRSCRGGIGYLIDGYVGWVEPKLGTLTEDADYAPGGCGGGAEPSEEYPLMISTQGGTSTDHPLLAPDQGDLRTQRGRTIISGTALPTVRSVTISTPRDVRTIDVSGPGHAFLVVYDGTFPGGVMRATAHFEDGRTKTMEIGNPGG